LVGAIFQQEGFCKVLMFAQGVIGILAAIFWQSGLGGWMGIVPLIFIFAVFYFLLILPQQRRQKKWQAMLDTLKTGDKVVTSGGLRGTIFAMRDDSVTLRVPPDNLKLEVTRGSIVSVTTEEITTK
jgi:preprotein translocase subunit YajC